MKFAVVAAAFAAVAATTNAVTCPADETLKLIKLAFEPSLEQCQTDSKFNFIPPSGVPTDEQLDLMCASDACPKTIAALKALNPSDCDQTFSNGVTLNVAQLIKDLEPRCGTSAARMHFFAAETACPASETTKLLQLAFEPTLEQCQIDSKFTFIPPSGVPTQEQVDLMCASDACHSTIAALQKLQPADCTQTFSNGVTLNVKQLLDNLVPQCGLRL